MSQNVLVCSLWFLALLLSPLPPTPGPCKRSWKAACVLCEGLSSQPQRALAGRRAGSPGLHAGAPLGRGFVSGGDIGPGSEPVTGPGLPGGELEFPGLGNVSEEKPERPLSQKEPGREQGSTPPHRHAGRTPGPWPAQRGCLRESPRAPGGPSREECAPLAGWGRSTGKKASLGGDPWLVLVVGLLGVTFSTMKNVGSRVSRTLGLLLSENSCSPSLCVFALLARRFPYSLPP